VVGRACFDCWPAAPEKKIFPFFGLAPNVHINTSLLTALSYERLGVTVWYHTNFLAYVNIIMLARVARKYLHPLVDEAATTIIYLPPSSIASNALSKQLL
jgi:hypothetical protein